MKILVTGDRNWQDYWTVLNALKEYGATSVVHGAAAGADTVAKNAAIDLGIEHIPYKADWKTYGRAAGSIRNRKQFDHELPDLVLAFHDNLKESKGTKDMIEYALSQGAKVILISSDKKVEELS